ncbi:MAG: phospholipase D-like domain-containing protein [Bacteroidia bacterium]
MGKIDPADWFLPQRQMARSPAFTSGNAVKALIDGKAYMDDLAEKLDGMVEGDYLYISGWRISPGMKLQPDKPGNRNLIALVTDLVKRKVTVKSMVWFLPNIKLVHAPFRKGYYMMQFLLGQKKELAQQNENLAFSMLIHEYGVSNPKTDAILDSRLRPNTVSSHHQKHVLLKSGNQHHAYVGGIDLSVDRWDTPDHDSPRHREKEWLDAWHDAQCRVTGPAVRQVFEQFAQRWNVPGPGNDAYLPTAAAPEPIRSLLPPANGNFGTVNVQVLRTLVCGKVYPFAPDGEQSVRAAYELAIKRAKHFIYIEDQYFWPCSLIRLLAEKAKQEVKIILVLAKDYDVPSGALKSAHQEMRWESIEIVARSAPGNMYVFHLEQKGNRKQIYVHSKLMIVDDCFVSIGSANINNRSHTNDSELQLSMIDDDQLEIPMGNGKATVCRFAHELRKQLWGEHLGISNLDELANPIASLTRFPNRNHGSFRRPSKIHHIAWHYREPSTQISDPEVIEVIFRFQDAIPKSWEDYGKLHRVAELAEPLDALGFLGYSVQMLSEESKLIVNTIMNSIFKVLSKIKLVRLAIKLLKEVVMNPNTTC